MRKLLCFFLFLVSSFRSIAQNYQCFSPNTIKYFTNSDGYLRGMRIDSVRSIGSDTIYYPYHTPRGSYGCYYTGSLDSNGGSWLGGKVIKDSDGTFLFDNLWHDTIIIKTQAHVGDSWIFFEDTTQISYKATLVALDTMTVLGTIDSVKKIIIEADSGGVINTLDPVNNFQILLSKHSGFVQVFDLYTFPYHRPDSIHVNVWYFDYYFDLLLGLPIVGGDGGCDPFYFNRVDSDKLTFKLIPFHSPTRMEIYDFNIGNIFESSDQITEIGGAYAKTTVAVDTILTKAITPYTVDYTFAIRTWITINSYGVYSYSGGYGASSLSADTSLMFSFNKLPEEWRAGYFFHYYPSQSIALDTGCQTAVYVYDDDNIDYSSAEILLQDHWGDPDVYMFGYSSTAYGIGYGQVGYHFYNYAMYGRGEDEGYSYVRKGGTECGHFSQIAVLGINEILTPSNVEIYPNPALSQLNISISGRITTIDVYNIIGQTVYSEAYNSEKVQIDVSALRPGVYFVKINGTDVRKFIKE